MQKLQSRKILSRTTLTEEILNTKVEDLETHNEDETQPTSLQKKMSNSRTIKSFCRIRPFDGVNCLFFKFIGNLSGTEGILCGGSCSYLSVNKTSIQNKSVEEFGNKFQFTDIFDEEYTQIEIFRDTCLDLLKSLLESRISSVLICQGLKSSGKSYTLVGDVDNPGILPLSMRWLYDQVKTRTESKVKIFCNYVEFFEEEIFDLLNDGKIVQLSENWRTCSFQDAVLFSLDSIKDCSAAINIGIKKRRMKGQSSLSSTVFKIVARFYNDKESQYQEANISMVDLMSSESGYPSSLEYEILKDKECEINKNSDCFPINRIALCLAKINSSPDFFNKTKNKKLDFCSCLLLRYLKFFLLSTTENIVVITNINPAEEYLNENLKVLQFKKLFELACSKIELECRKNPEKWTKKNTSRTSSQPLSKEVQQNQKSSHSLITTTLAKPNLIPEDFIKMKESYDMLMKQFEMQNDLLKNILAKSQREAMLIELSNKVEYAIEEIKKLNMKSDEKSNLSRESEITNIYMIKPTISKLSIDSCHRLTDDKLPPVKLVSNTSANKDIINERFSSPASSRGIQHCSTSPKSIQTPIKKASDQQKEEKKEKEKIKEKEKEKAKEKEKVKEKEKEKEKETPVKNILRRKNSKISGFNFGEKKVHDEKRTRGRPKMAK